MKILEIRCYNSPALESNFVLKVNLCEEIRIMLSHLSLRLPCPLRACSMFPLNFNQFHYLILQGLHLPIQNRHRPLDVIKATIELNVLQGTTTDSSTTHFLNWDTWKVSWIWLNTSGGSNQYVTLTTRAITLKGPINLEPSLPNFLNRITPF